MKIYKDGITLTVTIPSEIQRYKDAGYKEVVQPTEPALTPSKRGKEPEPPTE